MLVMAFRVDATVFGTADCFDLYNSLTEGCISCPGSLVCSS